MTAILNLALMMLKLRYELQHHPARRQPYRVFDRVTRKTVAAFDNIENVTTFRDSLINSSSMKVANEVNSGSFLPWVENAPSVQDLQREFRGDDGPLSLSPV